MRPPLPPVSGSPLSLQTIAGQSLPHRSLEAPWKASLPAPAWPRGSRSPPPNAPAPSDPAPQGPPSSASWLQSTTLPPRGGATKHSKSFSVIRPNKGFATAAAPASCRSPTPGHLLAPRRNARQYLNRALLLGVPPAGPGRSSCGGCSPAPLPLPPFPERSRWTWTLTLRRLQQEGGGLDKAALQHLTISPSAALVPAGRSTGTSWPGREAQSLLLSLARRFGLPCPSWLPRAKRGPSLPGDGPCLWPAQDGLCDGKQTGIVSRSSGILLRPRRQRPPALPSHKPCSVASR